MKLIIKNGTIINPVHHQHETGDVVIEDGKGRVQGAGVPVYRVQSLPNAADWRFYQYSSTRISAGEYEAR